MQHVWLAPNPGRFLGLLWLLASGSLFSISGHEDRVQASEQHVLVIDPGTEAAEVARIRARFDELGRVARARFRWSRLANALWCAFPVVLILVAVWASTVVVPPTDPLTDVATPVALGYGAVTSLIAIVCDRYTRRSVRQIAELEEPSVVRTSMPGRDRFIVRLVEEAERRTAAEQAQLSELLWQFAVADQARRDYLHQTAAFDDDEFSVLRVRSEDARRGLRAWAGEAAPA
ncbi:hypothetical protein ACH47X_04470 [Promicromonospora kroppenstedtii]|uniref:SLATT domain-containing protein n=1 Tax=Promicromonospora kroppenstedtii TaxID=440482 RepID=A0ABW7XF75_9MICO